MSRAPTAPAQVHLEVSALVGAPTHLTIIIVCREWRPGTSRGLVWCLPFGSAGPGAGGLDAVPRAAGMTIVYSMA